VGVKRTVFTAAVDTLRWVGRRGSMEFYSEAVQRFGNDLVREVTTPRGKIRFFCPNEMACWRAATLLTKEPETVEWIDGFGTAECLWDIGANIGVYSLYAALAPGVRVLAFEPASINYSVLCRNVELNRMDDRVQAYCMAFGEKSMVDSLNMLSTKIASSMHSFGVAEDYRGASFTPAFRQGVVGFAVDDFMEHFNPAFPNHLKIDVDGIEDRIVTGARRTLADLRLKSASVELVDDRADQVRTVLHEMDRAGMSLLHKKHGPMAKGPYATTFNYLFVRR